MKNAIGCVVVLAMAACGGSKAAPKTASETSSSTTLTLGELSFYEGSDLGMKLHADGGIEVKFMHDGTDEWKKVATLTARGAVLHDGKELDLQPDGSFHMSDGTSVPFHFEGDALVIAGKHVTIDDKGSVLQDGQPDQKPLRVEGVSDAGSKRAALVLLALMVAEKNEPVPAGTSATVGPSGPSM